MAVYPQVSSRAIDFLYDEMTSASQGCREKGSNWTKEDGLYNQVIFGLLKKTYLPLVMHQIQSQQPKDQVSSINEYHRICKKCLDIIAQVKGVFEIEAL